MILIGVLAIWLAIFRFGFVMLANDIRQIPFSSLHTWGDWRNFLFGKNEFAVSFLRFANLGVLNLLICLIPGVLLMRLRRPRPPWPELAHQPGFLACALLIATGFCLATLAALPSALLGSPPHWLIMAVPVLMAALVPMAWAILALRGVWRPESHWLDRLGRAVGVAWTISSAAHLMLVWPYF